MGKLGFHLFGFFIAYYGLMIVIGLAVAALVASVLIRRNHLDWDDFLILSAVCGLLGIVGAKLMYLVVSYREIDLSRLLDPEYLSSLMQGGFVFYGGLIGGLLGLWICKARFKIDVAAYIHCCTACIPIVHGFGRTGCFLVGCCYGVPHDGLFSVVYEQSLFAPNHLPLFPVQLVEAVGDFVIAGVLLVAYRKLKGLAPLYVYGISYAVMRFLLEYLRDDALRGRFGWFSTSQWVSIALLAVGGVLLARQYRLQTGRAG